MNIKKCFEPISSKPNDPDTEQDFSMNCSKYESHCSVSDLSLSQEHQDYLDLYCWFNSFYFTDYYHHASNKTNLIFFNDINPPVTLDTPKPLNCGTSITQLPNWELFCYGSFPKSGITLIIERNHKIRVLPSGTPCHWSSSIYFDSNIYCFGGRDSNFKALNVSRKFDLNGNRWVDLQPMPKADYCCNSVIFNGKIVISGYENEKVSIYSVDLDSFYTIWYDFLRNKRKILISTEERIYLIECGESGRVYESFVQDEYKWNILKIPEWCTCTHIIGEDRPSQVFCQYNNKKCFCIAEGENGKYFLHTLDSRYFYRTSWYDNR